MNRVTLSVSEESIKQWLRREAPRPCSLILVARPALNECGEIRKLKEGLPNESSRHHSPRIRGFVIQLTDPLQTRPHLSGCT
jgi:hypothetical protein